MTPIFTSEEHERKRPFFLLATVLVAFLLSGCTAQLNNAKRFFEDLTEPEDTSFKIDPLLAQIKTQDWQTFTAVNGTSPYVYGIYTGGGTIDSQTGAYQAPVMTGTSIVSVLDADSKSSYATVVVFDMPSISPTTLSLAAGNNFTFAVTGGANPYHYSVVSGEGTIHPTTGYFVASPNPGSVTIRVTDRVGNVSDSILSIQPALRLSVKSKVLNTNDSFNFVASGGVPPYRYSLVSGNGAIETSTGVYSAPALIGTDIIKVQDSLGNYDIGAVTINSSLLLGPTSSLMAQGSTTIFSARGGVPPYTYSATVGSVHATTGVYTAPGTPGGPYTVTVTDAAGAVSEAQVTITTNLSFVTPNITLPVHGSFDFSAITVGGVGAKSYSIASAQGVFVGSLYTAPATSGSYLVTVFDSQSPTPNHATATITVNPELSVTPMNSTLAVKNSAGFSVAGGVPPYTYTVQSGGGSVTSSGIYTAGGSSGSAVVKITDSYGSERLASITVNPPLSIDPVTTPMAANGSTAFTASGGVGSYTFTILSGHGVIHPTTGIYKAPVSAGSAVIEATDDLGNKAQATIQIVDPLKFSPATIAIQKESSITLSAMGGLLPYSYAVTSGNGAVDSGTGRFIAPAEPGLTVVSVTDRLGSQETVSIQVYDGLIISPVIKTVVKSQSFAFTANGGVAPYSFEMVSGLGTINPTTGMYIAANLVGAEVVRVTDSLGNTSDAQITVNDTLSITPANVTLAASNQQSFIAGGGVAPFIYTIASGGGEINKHSGDFKAGSTPGAVVLRVTDADGSTATASVTVNAALSMTPSSQDIGVSGSYTYVATHGVPPYFYSISSGQGTIGSSSGTYTAPSTPGTDIVRVTDALGNFVESHVQIFSAPLISPSAVDMAVLNQRTFSVAGGKSPYVFSLASGLGAIHAQSGLFTAGSGAGSVVVQVIDDLGQISTATVSVQGALTIAPTTVTLAAAADQSFTAAGGVAPYSYRIISGRGSIHGSVYSAPATGSGTAILEVMDSVGNTARADITHQDLPPASLTYSHDNAVYTKGVAIAENEPSSLGGTITSYSVTPSLPTGLELDTTTGVISGTPLGISATTNYTVTGTNSGGASSHSLSITVNDVAPLTLSYLVSSPIYVKDSVIIPNTPTASGGEVVSYSVSPSLPPGLTLDGSTGTISGTPTQITASNSYVITAANSGGTVDTALTIQVNDAPPATLSYGTAAAIYPEQAVIPVNSPATTGGVPTYYSITPDLPTGLILNTVTGEISGTPTEAQPVTSYTVTAGNVSGVATANITIRVSSVAISVFTYANAGYNVQPHLPATIAPSALGIGKPTSCTADASLPSGLVLNATSCVLSGTPTGTAGSARKFVITATNALGSISTELTLSVYGSTQKWAWVGGSSTPNGAAVYGTKGVATLTNTPGSRWEYPSQFHKASQTLWLFGGTDAGGATGLGNDLWKWDGRMWTWVSGSNTSNQPGVYGTQGVAHTANTPGARHHAMSWIDSAGNFYLFGGAGRDSLGNVGDLNDLWKFDGTQWTWLAGSKFANPTGFYSAVGVVNSANNPSGRGYGITWVDANNNLYLFGGEYFSSGSYFFQDLWRWNATQGWVLMHGSSATNQVGVYSAAGVAAAQNIPGARRDAFAWVDDDGSLMMYGGLGHTTDVAYRGYIAEMWKFDGTHWIYLRGSKVLNSPVSAGTKGVGAPANTPGARERGAIVKDDKGRVWLFGGFGYVNSTDSGYVNDLWMWDGSQWTWYTGTNSVRREPGVYGTLGVFHDSVTPGARGNNPAFWVDKNGAMFLFGGRGVSNITPADSWRFSDMFTFIF